MSKKIEPSKSSQLTEEKRKLEVLYQDLESLKCACVFDETPKTHFLWDTTAPKDIFAPPAATLEAFRRRRR